MLPKEAIKEFHDLLNKAGLTHDPEQIEVLANEFLAFMKIVMKGKSKTR